MQKNNSKRVSIMEGNKIKEIPYGISDFITIRDENLYYVDKTMYIPELENQARNLFFIRPRRFGKSLFINMLKAYYDCNTTAERFDELFGHLWIGQHPTSLQGKFQILHLDFSLVGGDVKNLERNFNAYCAVSFDYFVDKYSNIYSEDFIKQVHEANKAMDKLTLINAETAKRGLSLYLIIDEYDNFTNTVLNTHGEEVYHAITHANGFYRDVFKKFKGTFSRIFMTGVSPVTLDDVTSGFNIGWSISTNKRFNQMLGFSLEEVREMFTYYKEMGQLPAESDVEWMIEDMKPWYDNYCFSKSALKTQSKVFNCDMVVYYLRHYINEGEAPEQMIDPNTKTDYGKLENLLRLDQLDGDRKGVIRTIAERGEIMGNIIDSFPAKALTDPEIFPSLLFYYGMLTIKGTFGDQLILGIPNNNVRKQYYGYLLAQYQEEKYVNLAELKTKFTYMAFEGNWQEALESMAKAYADVSSVRDGIEAERNIQGFFMAYLSLNNYYITAPELELSHGYCDFFLLPNLTHYTSKHSYIIELKILSKKEWNEKVKDDELGEVTKAEKQWHDAVKQIKGYAQAPRVEALRQGTTLHKIIMQFEGWELKRMDEV